MQTYEADPAPEDVADLLGEIGRSTDRVAATLGALGQRSFLAPSALAGWNRATIAAHLTWVAGRHVAMTADVLGGAPTTTYPGGPAERAASLTGFDTSAPQDARERFLAASAALACVWGHLDDRQWSTTFREERFGAMRLARLAALRLTELEVHHLDLDCGYQVADWPSSFVRTCLPLRISWLGAHHSRRADADRRVEGRWLLAPSDIPNRWLITARAGHVRSDTASEHSEADVTVAGSSASLLAFLLGRVSDLPLDIRGNRVLAHAFKRSFPGP